MKHYWVMAITVVTFTIFITGQTQAAPYTYTITDLGALGGTFSEGTGINDAGQVVGYSYDGTYHAFRSTSTGLQDLGTLGGANPTTMGASINDAGEVTGYSYTGPGGNYHAFRSTSSGLEDLGTLIGPGGFSGLYSVGTGINNAGQVTGYSSTDQDPGAPAHAFRTTSTGLQDLGTLGGTYSYGEAINNVGQVAGGSGIVGDAALHAFRTTRIGLQDLGTLGGTNSEGTAINDVGQVTGGSNIANSTASHAFLSTTTGLQDLGTLGGTNSVGQGINNAGQVVGSSGTGGDAASHAFLWDGTSMYDLNSLTTPDSGWVLIVAYDINNVDQITGYGSIDGQDHAFLLTENTPASAPEPASLAVLGVGVLGLGSIRWRLTPRRRRPHFDGDRS